MKKLGFTLIEILVVVGILGMVMVVSGVVLTNTLRTGNRVVSSDEVETAGTYILGELRKAILASRPDGIVSCSESEVTLTSRIGESTTLLKCSGGNISSNLAQLNPPTVTVLNDCMGFLSCETDLANPVINIGFTLSKGDAADVTKRYVRSFESRVVMR